MTTQDDFFTGRLARAGIRPLVPAGDQIPERRGVELPLPAFDTLRLHVLKAVELALQD